MTPGSASPKPYGMDPRPGATRTRREDSSPQPAPPFAAIGTAAEAAHPALTSSVTSVQGAETSIMRLRNVLELECSLLIESTLGNTSSTIVIYMSNIQALSIPYAKVLMLGFVLSPLLTLLLIIFLLTSAP